MKPLKEKISITIDNDILQKIKDEAEYDDRSPIAVHKHYIKAARKKFR